MVMKMLVGALSILNILCGGYHGLNVDLGLTIINVIIE